MNFPKANILHEQSYAIYTTNRAEQSRNNLQLSKDSHLLEWAQEQFFNYDNGHDIFNIANNVRDPVLVIGVKTAALSNFACRQAIRETWRQQVKQLDVEVFFLGCVPITSDERLQNAVTMEKRVYRDLLTEELECEDSYFSLADKRQYFHKTSYVILVDDDAFVLVEKLVNVGSMR
ncbi:hypothetical protein PHMEG_0005902 [Phytophthora megakarya]|uniref:Hexosyltransferase n=1 Tax=Phytophthora megakarya TaxID=4795 RepID=A0A225WQF9_9STRA|nr:hypothetical protein PHMEG_0005902 [Phytophthora megakarya]